MQPGVKNIVKKDCQVASKRMPLGAHWAVKTHHTGGRFAETAKNVRWSTSPQEAGQGSWDSGPDQRTKQTWIRGKMARMAELDWWTAREKNWQRMTSHQSCYYQPGGSLTRCQNLKVQGGGNSHESEWSVGSVALASLRILVWAIASVMGARSQCRPKVRDWTAWYSPMPICDM